MTCLSVSGLCVAAACVPGSGACACELGKKIPGRFWPAGFWVLSQGTIPRETWYQLLVRLIWLCLGFLTGAPDLAPEGLLDLLGLGYLFPKLLVLGFSSFEFGDPFPEFAVLVHDLGLFPFPEQ